MVGPSIRAEELLLLSWLAELADWLAELRALLDALELDAELDAPELDALLDVAELDAPLPEPDDALPEPDGWLLLDQLDELLMEPDALLLELLEPLPPPLPPEPLLDCPEDMVLPFSLLNQLFFQSFGTTAASCYLIFSAPDVRLRS